MAVSYGGSITRSRPELQSAFNTVGSPVAVILPETSACSASATVVNAFSLAFGNSFGQMLGSSPPSA
jgi:hypothetical protein